ncbi:MAG: hypothetical protein IKI49_06445 [Oscillospiraceae bacterium]|nr:hypothetical protein [Oscillospiraceae bacterium]
MDMKELAREYRHSAALIRDRTEELKTKAKSPRISPDERYGLNQRIVDLELIMGETMRTANTLETYYG